VNSIRNVLPNEQPNTNTKEIINMATKKLTIAQRRAHLLAFFHAGHTASNSSTVLRAIAKGNHEVCDKAFKKSYMSYLKNAGLGNEKVTFTAQGEALLPEVTNTLTGKAFVTQAEINRATLYNGDQGMESVIR
jgi:hypothetical protein